MLELDVKNVLNIEIKPTLPSIYDQELRKRYLDLYGEEVEVYPAYTLNDNLNIVVCVGIMHNDGSHNYHNNYDDSKPIMQILTRTKLRYGTNVNYLAKYWTTDVNEILYIQRMNLNAAKNQLHKINDSVNNLSVLNLVNILPPALDKEVDER